MIFFSLIIAINILVYIFNRKIALKLNLYDYPDKLRKLHKSKVPLTGGIIILVNILFTLLFIIINNLINNDLIFFKTNLDLFIFTISTIVFFLVGYCDDKYNISATKRFLFILLILIPIIYFSEDLLINHVRFSFTNNSFIFSQFFSIFWTILCFLLFINAMNMFDGINYQVAFYCVYLSLVFVLNQYFNIFFLNIIIGLIIFIVLNHKYESFFGDSGSYLLAFIFSYLFIKMYNQTTNITADQIVLFMIIPGIDLMRLFITRIINGKPPFVADRNHIHHKLLLKSNLINTNLIIQSLIIFPSMLGYYFGSTIIFLVIQMMIYFYFVYFYN
tara:strand:- start:283 stop:1275 length:993 start_codon:yes stop_codon:yes gene_type:complete